MSSREFLTNAGIILAVMALGSLLETVAPFLAEARSRRGRRTANLALTALSFLSNWLLASGAAILALKWRPAGLMASMRWPISAQVLTGVVLLDFSVGYVSHRLLHASAVMWRFHQIHHSDDFVDVTTTYRTHPVETAWRVLFAIVPIWILGIPAQAVVIQRLLQTAWGILEHSNVRLARGLDRVLSAVVVTPNIHKIHHSRDVSETNSNFANVVVLYDRLFRTFTPADRAYDVVYGLDDVNPAGSASFPRLLTMPFGSSDTGAARKSVASGVAAS